MSNYKTVFFTLGILQIILGVSMFIPIIAPGDDVKHLVPSLLADAKELKFPRPSRTWPLPCADAACFRVHFNLVDPVSTNDEPKLFYQTKDYSDSFFLICAFHRNEMRNQNKRHWGYLGSTGMDRQRRTQPQITTYN